MRKTIAAIVAVAVLSTGSAACTPQQTEGALRAVGNLITLILFAYAMGSSHPVPMTTPPTTVVEPVGT